MMAAFGSSFRRRSMTGAQTSFWRSFAPPELVKAREGRTEVDVVFEFEGHIVLMEAKYRAGLSTRTAHDANRDQVLRLLDLAYGLGRRSLFVRQPFVVVMGLSEMEPPMVARYRDENTLRTSLRHYERQPDWGEMCCMLSRSVSYVPWSRYADSLADEVVRARKMERAFLRDVFQYVRWKIGAGTLARRGNMFIGGSTAPEELL
jgi:hypothetical protein